MPMMKMLMSKTLRTLSGHTLRFEPNVATNVPMEAVNDAQAAGAVITDNSGIVDEETAGHQNFAVAAELRKSLILRAMEMIVTQNKSGNFDAGGRPKMAAVQMIVPVDTSQNEIDDIYTAMKTSKANGEALVVHPQTDLAMKALDLQSREEVIKMGKKMGADKACMQALNTQPMSDAKARLIGLFSGYQGD